MTSSSATPQTHRRTSGTNTLILLTVKVENGQTDLGLFKGAELLGTWSATTNEFNTPDELALMVHSFLSMRGLPRPQDSILGSVVPSLTGAWVIALRDMIGKKPLVIGPGVKTGLAMDYKDPAQVGADRVACCTGAKAIYGPSTIVADFSTATTISVIGDKGSFLGGAIAPGIRLSVEALYDSSAQLADISRQPVHKIIGRTTSESIRSGIYFGETARVDGLIKGMWLELGYQTQLVATGRFAEKISALSSLDFQLSKDLPHLGMRAIYVLNRG